MVSADMHITFSEVNQAFPGDSSECSSTKSVDCSIFGIGFFNTCILQMLFSSIAHPMGFSYSCPFLSWLPPVGWLLFVDNTDFWKIVIFSFAHFLFGQNFSFDSELFVFFAWSWHQLWLKFRHLIHFSILSNKQLRKGVLRFASLDAVNFAWIHIFTSFLLILELSSLFAIWLDSLVNRLPLAICRMPFAYSMLGLISFCRLSSLF